MLRFLDSLTGLGRLVLGGLALALIVAALFALETCRGERAARTEARLGRNQAEAALASGADAAGTVGAVSAGAADSEQLTRENTDAIRSAPGADRPVDPALDAVARERLCRRAAYRDRPECLQHTPAR